MKSKVIQISERMWEVLGHNVTFQKKKGRQIILCSCQNSARFIDNNFCYHKQLVLEYLALKPINEKLDKLINDYSGFTNIKAKFDAEVFLGELKKLKGVLNV